MNTLRIRARPPEFNRERLSASLRLEAVRNLVRVQW